MTSLRMMAIVVVWFSFIGAAYGQPAIANRMNPYGGSTNEPESVFSEARSTLFDLLITTDGDRLHGVLGNEKFHLHTPYAYLVLETRRLAGLTFNTEPRKRTAIASVLGDRFSGYLEERVLRFVRDDGTPMQLDRRFVSKVILAVRPDERDGLVLTDHFETADVDEFYGRVIDPSFQVTTSYATLPVVFQDVHLMRIRGLYGRRDEVEFADGKQFSGWLAPRKFEVLLDIGVRVTIDTCAVGLTKLERPPDQSAAE
jgi:hypothetical protein